MECYVVNGGSAEYWLKNVRKDRFDRAYWKEFYRHNRELNAKSYDLSVDEISQYLCGGFDISQYDAFEINPCEIRELECPYCDSVQKCKVLEFTKSNTIELFCESCKKVFVK